MSKLAPTLFEDARMEIGGAIDLTIQSLRACAHHEHWVITWSGGKDSTALVTLIIALILNGEIRRPKTLTILFADTRMELPPLAASFQVIAARLAELGFPVQIVMAPLERRFLPYILGRGVPPPNNTTLRWCTRQIKLEPMGAAVQQLHEQTGEKLLVLTGVRQGESAVRDARIKMSCGKNGAECGQGWFQQDLTHGVADKLAPILHWRVCLVWDWLTHYARTDAYGGFQTQMLAEAYGHNREGSQAEINARTGCVCCPLASQDTALDAVIQNRNGGPPEWSYIAPMKELRTIYRQMREPQYRLRQSTGERRKDGKLSANQNRMGPLTIDARREFTQRILAIQDVVNANRPAHHPAVDILNEEEMDYIRWCWNSGLYPNRWTGNEPSATLPFLETYADGSQQLDLFIGQNWPVLEPGMSQTDYDAEESRYIHENNL